MPDPPKSVTGLCGLMFFRVLVGSVFINAARTMAGIHVAEGQDSQRGWTPAASQTQGDNCDSGQNGL